MDESERKEKEIARKLQKNDFWFQLAKSLLFIFIGLMFSIYIVTAIQRDNQHTRTYIKCVVNSIFYSTKPDIKASVEKCG